MKYPHKLALVECCGVRWYVIMWQLRENEWLPSHYDSCLARLTKVMQEHVLAYKENEWDGKLYDSFGMELSIDYTLAQERSEGVRTGSFRADTFPRLVPDVQSEEIPFGNS